MNLWDQICNTVSHRAYHGLSLAAFQYSDPFLSWIVALGAREGAWLKANGK